MKSKENILLAVYFTLALLLTCNCYQSQLRRKSKMSFQDNSNKCFEFQLVRKPKNLKSTLNLINLFSFHKALKNNAMTFTSFHQEKTNLIFKKESLIEKKKKEVKHEKSNNISVYLQNKHNTEVIRIIKS